MDEIIKGKLWLGDIGDCTDPDLAEKIDCVISLCPEFRMSKCEVENRWHCGFADNAMVHPLVISKAVLQTMTGLADGHRTLVHCAGGISRSPTIVACVLVKLGLYQTIDKALEFIATKRPMIYPSKKTIMSAEKYLESRFPI